MTGRPYIANHTFEVIVVVDKCADVGVVVDELVHCDMTIFHTTNIKSIEKLPKNLLQKEEITVGVVKTAVQSNLF